MSRVANRGVPIPAQLRMTDHDRELFNYALHEKEWTGLIGCRGEDDFDSRRVDRRRLSDGEKASLLDDSTSGGIEVAPIAFDDAIVLTPVLYGELFPRVNVINVPRGRRMKGGSIGNPTFTSNVAEGTAITPFDATAFIAAFDTKIFNAVGAMDIGLDFQEDSPANIGQIVIAKYGEKAQEWLDRVIAVGTGTTEPTGIFTASGTTSVSSENGNSGPPTVSDYEGLMFGVGKAYRKAKGGQCVYVANDTTYRRARGIAVNPTDERRVFGMTHCDYMLLDHPYCIQNDIANTKAGYFNPGFYRMYRRLGLNVRVETAGRTNALANQATVVVRMRWGGQPELGGAVAVMTDCQS